MDYQSYISNGFIAFYAVWILVGLVVNGMLVRQLCLGGGKVITTCYGPPDAGLACFFISWFAWLTVAGFSSKQRPVTNSDLMTGAFHVSMIVLAIFLFLTYRKISVSSQFGLNRKGLVKALFLPAPLLLAAFPLVASAGALMARVMRWGTDPQELVKYFTEAATTGKVEVVVYTMIFGVLVAPAAEEFIFRGYLYSVAKKYLGIIPSMILVSALFAAIHLNLASLPSLFVLAICFTLAYECTGSILVPILMHALFNFSEFAMMLATPHLHP